MRLCRPLGAGYHGIFYVPMFSRNCKFILVGVSAVSAVSGAEPFPFFEPVRPPRLVQVMVHRGVNTAAPENTRQAIQMCIEDYYEWVEIDVQLTKDGKHIVFHDNRLEVKSDGEGLVADHTLDQILALDAGSWFASRFTGDRVLTLAEALEIGKGRINFYLDCKRIDPELLASEVIASGMQKQVIIYDSPEMISKVRAASNGSIPVMTKWRPPMGDPAAFAARHSLAAVEIDADDITEEIVVQFKKSGVKTQAKVLGERWDNPTTWRRVTAAGAEWLQTDKPLEMLTTKLRDEHPQWPVKVAYHRGASRYAPENSIPAIQLAAILRADFIEIDIRTTKDGKHFLLHDGTLNRTTNGKGLFRDSTAESLVQLDAGAWFGKPYSGTPLPTFEAAIDAMGDYSAAYLDCKDIAPEQLAKILRERGLLNRSAVYQSLDYLRKLKELEPEARVMPPLNKLSDLEQIASIKPYAVDAKWDVLSNETIANCHEKGILVFSDALGRNESVEQYRKAMSWGLDMIQTDHPARVLRAVELQLTESF